MKRENIADLEALSSKGTRRGKEEVKELTVTRNGQKHTFQFDDFGKHKRGMKNAEPAFLGGVRFFSRQN